MVIGVNALAAYLLPTLMPVSRVVAVFAKPLVTPLGPAGAILASGAVLVAGRLILL